MNGIRMTIKNSSDTLYRRVVPLYIKHNRFMDVAIRITKPIEKIGNCYVIYGKYVNQAFVETFEMGIPTKIVIPASKFEGNWQFCKTPGVKCIRRAEWGRL